MIPLRESRFLDWTQSGSLLSLCDLFAFGIMACSCWCWYMIVAWCGLIDMLVDGNIMVVSGPIAGVSALAHNVRGVTSELNFESCVFRCFPATKYCFCESSLPMLTVFR